MRIVVLISGGGSTLLNLIERIADGRLRDVEISGVVSSRATVRGVQIARSAGLPTDVVRVQDFADADAFSAALTAACDARAPDLAVMGGFLCFWRFPESYAGRVVNIHPALLPGYGGRGMFGARVHDAVLASGDPVSGCTVHLVDHEYDHGPIIAQRRVGVRIDDTAESLARRVGAAERELYPSVLQQVADRGVPWLLAAARRWAGGEND